MVLFIHRYDYQGLSEDVAEAGKTDLIIAKHRNGEIGGVPLMFRASEVRFVDMEETIAASSFIPVSSIMNDEPADPFGGIPVSSGGEFVNPEF